MHKVSKRIFHVKDDTDRQPGKFDWAEKIWIPVSLGAISLIATGIGGWLGLRLTNFQESNAEAKRLIERASTASNDRQAVLTNYASRITDLIAEQGLMDIDQSNPEKQATLDALRGESIIALKRLDDSREDGKGEIDILQKRMEDLELQSRQNIFQIGRSNNSEESQLEELIGFDDSGELKGELVRFLYETKLLRGTNASDPEASLLRGADLTRVMLNNAPLYGINLKRAWIPQGNLNKADLQRSDLRGTELSQSNLDEANLMGANLGWANLQSASLKNANLSSADLESADLRGADLSKIKITPDTVFTDACYNASTLGLDNFNIESLGMIDVSKEPLDTKCSALKPAT